MTLFLLRIWPAFVPIMLYLVWHSYRKRKAVKAGTPKPALLSGPWQLTLMAALLCYAGGLIYFALSKPQEPPISYEPKRFENGQLVEEEIQR